MTAFGQSTFDTPQVEQIQNKKIVDLRISLITEEFKEIEKSINDNNFIEYIDGIADLLVVTYGTCHAFGINIDNWIDIFCIPEGIKRENNTNYDMIKKTTDFIEENTLEREDLSSSLVVKYFIKKINNNIQNLINLIKYDFDYSLNIYEYLIKISYVLTHIIVNTYNLAIIFNIDINKAFDIVHESNMSKLCFSKEEAIQTVDWYLKNEKRYPTPSYKKATNNKHWIVFEQSNGKILKSINYNPADLKDI
jgi:predicted HAD superfamily Cof-like phosphohydrolase